MRQFVGNVVTLSVLLGSIIGIFTDASSAAAASSGGEQREVRAQCTTSVSGGPKLITNIAPVKVDKSLTTVRAIIEQINYRSAETMRKLGMTYDQNVGCQLIDPTLPWTDGNNPEEEVLRFRQILQGQGYKLVQVDRLDEDSTGPAESTAEPTANADDARAFCQVQTWNQARGFLHIVSDLFVPSDLPPNWKELQGRNYAGKSDTDDCRDFPAAIDAAGLGSADKSTYRRIFGNAAGAEEDLAQWTVKWTRLAWKPKTAGPSSSSSKLQRKTVFFRSPHDNERGYSGVSFDIDYQFLVCMGELHLAYSLDPESVHIGTDRITSSSRRAHYTYKAHYYQVAPPPPHVESVALRGKVFHDSDGLTPIGTFGDNFAGKALGFGCFSGQTKKIADLKDLGRYVSKQPTKEELAKFFDELHVSFQTNDLLTSTSAEEEIRDGIAKQAAHNDEYIGTGAGDEVVRELEGNKAAEERAARRAAEEAEFQAKQKAYEEGMAEHKAAVEQYRKALADNEAQKAANTAAAQAQQEEVARKQAAYEAELARAREAQAEYEAKYGKPQ